MVLQVCRAWISDNTIGRTLKKALKPHRNRQWVIPPGANAGFVAAMEDVLEAFLMAMQRVVRGVEVEDDLLERLLVRLQEEVDEQGLRHTSGRSGSRGFW